MYIASMIKDWDRKWSWEGLNGEKCFLNSVAMMVWVEVRDKTEANFPGYKDMVARFSWRP
jgi:hypothetical protein